MTGDDFNKLLNGSRLLMGAASFAAPDMAFRAAGLESRGNPQLPVMTRMFGIRDVAIGAGALTSSGEERRRWLQAAIVADVGDALAVLAAHRAGYLSTAGALMLGIAATTGTALGIAALTSGD